MGGYGRAGGGFPEIGNSLLLFRVQPLPSFLLMFLLQFPSWVVATVVCGGSVAISLIGAMFVHRRIPSPLRRPNNEVGGFIYATLGVVYAVILAFVVVVVWEQFSDTQAVVEREADAVGDLALTARAFPESAGIAVRAALMRYAETVVRDEWPHMARGEESAEAYAELVRVGDAFNGITPANDRERAAYAECLRLLSILRDQRRGRIIASSTSLPPLMWVLLIGGGVLTVFFTFLFGSEKPRAQFWMTGMLAGMIGFVLFLILALDLPFTGGLHVTPEAFQHVIMHVQ